MGIIILEEFVQNMVRPKEFESLTAGTANRCSIQLSYGRTFSKNNFHYFVGRNYIIYNLEYD